MCCNKNYQKRFDGNLKERFFNTYDDINKLILLLQKGVCHEYMDDWEKFGETSLLEKEDFYRHLNMEDITDTDYAQTRRACKDLEIKKWGQYRDLCSKYIHYC